MANVSNLEELSQGENGQIIPLLYFIYLLNSYVNRKCTFLGFSYSLNLYTLKSVFIFHIMTLVFDSEENVDAGHRLEY